MPDAISIKLKQRDFTMLFSLAHKRGVSVARELSRMIAAHHAREFGPAPKNPSVPSVKVPRDRDTPPRLRTWEQAREVLRAAPDYRVLKADARERVWREAAARLAKKAAS